MVVRMPLVKLRLWACMAIGIGLKNSRGRCRREAGRLVVELRPQRGGEVTGAASAIQLDGGLRREFS